MYCRRQTLKFDKFKEIIHSSFEELLSVSQEFLILKVFYSERIVYGFIRIVLAVNTVEMLNIDVNFQDLSCDNTWNKFKPFHFHVAKVIIIQILIKTEEFWELLLTFRKYFPLISKLDINTTEVISRKYQVFVWF